MLVATDSVAVLAAWLVVLGLAGLDGAPPWATAGLAVAATLCSLLLISRSQLYLARVCRLRSVEVSRLARASLVAGAAVYLAAGPVAAQLQMRRFQLTAEKAAEATAASFLLLAWGRSLYASALRARRRKGHLSRPVVILGANEEGRQLQRHFAESPELGFDVVALARSSDEVVPALELYMADSVVVATSALQKSDLNSFTRRLLDSGVHVHLSCGLFGIDHRRLRPSPMGHEPLFYVEGPMVSPWHRLASRALDIVGSLVGLVVTLPLLLVAAVAIKLQDRGRLLFRQTRIGRDGKPFTLYKLRTMVPDAERRLALVAAENERKGPLFKSVTDCRITRVGRVLRATSIDELPQLVNVLKGSMSLVGPRPALPSEVDQFDEELLTRHRVRPGITGLWQVEARNDPSFGSYRRLDLFYVENWSLELDLAILLATAKGLVGQALHDLRRRRPVRIRAVERSTEVDVEAMAVSPSVAP